MEDQKDLLIDENKVKNPDVETQHIISLNKFIFLSIISFGTYEVWWMYKAWRFFKQKEKLDILPAARAIFAIFYLNSLFNRILNLAKEKGYKENYSGSSLFVGFIITNLLSKLPDPFWMVSIISFVFIIPPFKALNYAKESSDDLTVIDQTSFSTRQILLSIGGLIFWVLVIIGFTME